MLAQNTNFKLGRVQQFNVNVEHQLPGQIVLTVGYAGSRSSHILVNGNNMNVGSPAACGTVSGYTLGCGSGGAAFGVPYPAFPYSVVSNIFDVGQAHYNSLQIKAETKSIRHGIYALIGYTYARAYDNGFTDGLGTLLGAPYFPLPGWQKLDWALVADQSQSQLHGQRDLSTAVRQGANDSAPTRMAWASAIVGNWEVTIIEKATSGFPVFVVDSNNSSGVNFQNNGNSLKRPNQTCSPTGGSSTLSQFFKTSCFSAPADGELGNANRAPVSGPDFVNTDFSVIKHFPIREDMRLDFRAEFFNLFNHAQFANPGGDFNSPATFGVINSTVNNPRLVQFAVKLAF